jgi:hypothetical protein
MTIKKITAFLIGLVFCFSFMAKQIQQTHLGFYDDQTVQDVLPESTNTNNQLDADNALDVIDDIIMVPLLPFITILLITLLHFSSRLYSQPTFLVPERPPSKK